MSLVEIKNSSGTFATINSPQGKVALATGGTIVRDDIEVKANIEKYGWDVVVVPYAPPTWANGTDAEIVEALQMHYAGEIDLHDYWNVGDEREVSLGAIASSGTANGVTWSVGESQSAQTVELVLMDTTCTGFTFVDNGGTPAFIVGQKNGLTTTGYMNSSNTNSGGYAGSVRAKWCDGGYWNAIPSTLRSAFRKFRWQGGIGGGASSGLQNEDHWFALTPAKCVFGSTTHYAQTDEDNLLAQWTWYQTPDNRIKKLGESGSTGRWWESSPYSGDSGYFCNVNSNGSAGINTASYAVLLAPFGCI